MLSGAAPVQVLLEVLHEPGNPLGIIRKPGDYVALADGDRCQKRSVPHFMGSALPDESAAAAAASNSLARQSAPVRGSEQNPSETEQDVQEDTRTAASGTGASKAGAQEGGTAVEQLIGAERSVRSISGDR